MADNRGPTPGSTNTSPVAQTPVTEVFGTPGDGKVVQWNATTQRLEWGASSGAYAPLTSVALRRIISCTGTSITNQGFYSQGTKGSGWAPWANAICNWGYELLNNGVSGEDSSQILARVPAVIAGQSRPGVAVCEAGIPNDIGHARTVAQAMADMQSIYDLYAAAGWRVFVCTALPYGLSDTTGNRTYIATFNAWARKYAREHGHRLIDWHTAVTAQDSTGAWYPGYSSDLIHPEPPAAKVMGQVVAAALIADAGRAPSMWLPSSNGDPLNLVANGMMLGTGGTTKPAGVTGNLADSWASYNNGGTTAGLLSKVARTDGIQGEWQKIEMTVGNADGIKIQGDNTGLGTAFSVGDLILCAFEWATDPDWVNGLDLNAALYFGASATAYAALQRPSTGAGSTGFGQPPPSGVLVVTGTVPSDATRLQPQIAMRADTGVGYVGRIGCWNLTKMGLTA